MTRGSIFLVAMGVAGILGVTGYMMWSASATKDKFAQCRVSGGAGASIGGPFTLVNQAGKTVTDKEVIKGPTLVYFGYTYCPDACPIDNARNANVIDLLDARGISATPVFISIDPARDTPQVMADYVKYFHKRMIGLTGSYDQVKAAAKAYKVYYHKASDESEYLMDHSTFTYLMFPGTGFAEFFKRDASAADVAESVACFTNAM